MQADEMIDEFFQGYVTCALWSSTDNADDSGGEPLDKNYSESDIATDTLAEMKADCLDFLRSKAGRIISLCKIDPEYAGHDYWLTRNGHGAGFWDRGYGRIGDELTKLCKPYGGYDLYIGDDGKIHG